jgi:hypothetical protein
MGLLSLILAFLVGGCIGYGFGLVQARALRRYEKMQAGGKLKHYANVMPGSMSRVAMLLVVLVLVQVVCPVLFAGGTQWWVSGGVVAGYGYHLYQQLQAKRKAG